MGENHSVLNKLFTQSTFGDLVKNPENQTYDTIVKKYIKDRTGRSNGEILSGIYKYMSEHYRNEYFYQNTLLNKILLGRHSLNTTTALTQIPVGKSKADFVLINGKAVVYEIKTELDSFERLKNQLADYYKAFPFVCVITCEQKFQKLSQLLMDTPVGICVLSDRNTIQVRKAPEENRRNLSYRDIFKVLHKQEFENLLESYFGSLPESTPAFYYDACFQRFSKIPMETLYILFLKELKKRNRVLKEDYKDVPYELKSLMYFYHASHRDYIHLSRFLNDSYRG